MSDFLVFFPKVELVFPYVYNHFGKQKVVVVRFCSIGLKLVIEVHPFFGKEAANHEVPPDCGLSVIQREEPGIEVIASGGSAL